MLLGFVREETAVLGGGVGVGRGTVVGLRHFRCVGWECVVGGFCGRAEGFVTSVRGAGQWEALVL